MSRHPLSLRAFVLGVAASLAAFASAQNGYTETTYQFQHDPHRSRIGPSRVSKGSPMAWTEQGGSFFCVTGDTDDTPPWRLLFSSLANNSWVTTKDFSETFGPGDVIYDVQDYYTEDGTEGLTPNFGGGGEKRRDLNDFIVNDLTYDVVPFGTADPGDGPGGPG